MSEMSEMISPIYVGEDRFGVEVETPNPSALQPLTVIFDYSGAGDIWVRLPIEIIVQPAARDASGYVRRTFRRVVPSSFTFVPIASGEHLVLIREVGHNRWLGRALVDVAGDKASEVSIAAR